MKRAVYQQYEFSLEEDISIESHQVRTRKIEIAWEDQEANLPKSLLRVKLRTGIIMIEAIVPKLNILKKRSFIS